MSSFLELRRLAFQVAVLHDLDLEPADDGVVLAAAAITVPWEALEETLSGRSPDSPEAAARAAGMLADVAALAIAADLSPRVRPVGVPHDAPYHPGSGWVRHRLLGGAVDFGMGFLGLRGDPDRVDTPSALALQIAGIDVPSQWWDEALEYLETMGARLVERLSTEPLPTGRQAALRPIGDADVVTLLGSRALRTWLARRDGTGMCSIAVPMRRRGWIDLRALDPAFIPAAAATIDPGERGFSRPLLVTADEVSVAIDRQPS